MSPKKLMKRQDFIRKLLFLDTGGGIVSRLRGKGGPAGSLPGGERLSFTFMRPPHALLEPAFLAECTACGLCIEVCPDAVLIKGDDVLVGRGTPLFDPSLGSCTACDLCVEACADGALLPNEDAKMGKAIFLASNCLLTRGEACSACLDSCPEEGAISIEDKSVLINAENCTGCAFCFHACPSEPKSIELRGRPPLPLRAHPVEKANG